MDYKSKNESKQRIRASNLLFFLIFITFVTFMINLSLALPVLLSDQGTDVKNNSVVVTTGNITILIYDNATAGTEIYNQTFVNNITNGSWNIMINPDLEFGRSYWKDYSINSQDLDFDGVERLEFNSPLGLINDVSFINFSLIDSCTSGSSIRVINEDGSVVCETDDGLGGSLNPWINDSSVTYIDSGFPQNVNFTGNLTLGQKITFVFGEIIDNIVDGFIRVTGGLNVTGNAIVWGNLTVDTNTLFVDSDNNRVGIGTTSPGSNGIGNPDLEVVDGDFARISMIATDPTNDVKFLIDARGDGTDRAQIDVVSAHDLAFLTNNTNRMIISSTGNVGIGASDLRSAFEVVSSNNALADLAVEENYHLKIRNPNDVAGEGAGISFGMSSTNSQQTAAIVAKRTGTNGQGTLQFYTKQSTTAGVAPVFAMIIDQNGNVGIGTSSPGYLLEVNSSTLGITNLATSAAEDAIAIGVDGEQDSSIKFFDDDAESTQHFKLTFSASTQDIRFQSDTVDNILYMDNAGNVGIGQSSPDVLLTLDASSGNKERKLLGFYEDTESNFWIQANFTGTGTTGNWITMKDWSGDDVMTWRGDGRVGIGTTTPSAALNVIGVIEVSNEIQIVDDGSATDPGLTWDGDGNMGIFRAGTDTLGFTTSGSEAMRIDSSGDVGIGTTSPQAKFDVSSNLDPINGAKEITLANVQLRVMNSVGSTGDGSGIKFGVSSVNANPGGGAIVFERTGSNAQGRLHFATKETTGADSTIPIRMTISNDGKVGINETEPNKMLHIEGIDPEIYLHGTKGNAFESGRIRFAEKTTGGGDNFIGGFIHFDGSANDFNIGVHNPADQTTSNDVNAITIDRTTAEVEIPNLGSAGATDVCRNSGNALSTCSSSERYKKNIETLPLGLETVMQLHPITFDWKDTNISDLGFVAEEVEKINSLLVTYHPDKNETSVEGVKYKQITAILVNAIKQQQEQINALIAGREVPVFNNSYTNNNETESLNVSIGNETDNSGGSNSTLWINDSSVTYIDPSFPQNVNFTGNLTMGEKIIFSLGEIIDNIVDGWIRVTGGLNVSIGNETESLNVSVGNELPVFNNSYTNNNETESLNVSIGNETQPLKVEPKILDTSGNFNLFNVIVNGLAIFMDIIVSGHAEFGGDTVGQATISSEETEITISFEKEYQNNPIITISLIGLHDINYGIEDISSRGFKIITDPSQSEDIVFNWHAFASNENIVTSNEFAESQDETIETQEELANLSVEENNVSNVNNDSSNTSPSVEENNVSNVNNDSSDSGNDNIVFDNIEINNSNG